MDLKLLGFENFEIAITYDILLSNESSEHVIGSNEWINMDFSKKNLLCKIEMGIFEEIFDKSLKFFPFYDSYDITEFRGAESEKLLHLLEQERQINSLLTNGSFRQKYEYLYAVVQDEEDFLLTYDAEKLNEFIREDVDTIITTLIEALKMSADNNQIVTIVGI